MELMCGVCPKRCVSYVILFKNSKMLRWQWVFGLCFRFSLQMVMVVMIIAINLCINSILLLIGLAIACCCWTYILTMIRCCFLQILLQNMCIGRFNAFIVMFFRFNNFKSEFLIELYGTFVIHLYMSAKWIKKVMIQR